MYSMSELDTKPKDIGDILVRVQDDLRHLREQLLNTTSSNGEVVFDLRALESAIEKTESGIRDHSDQVVKHINNQVLTLPALESSMGPVPPKTKPSSDVIPSYSRRVKSAETKYKGLLEPILIEKTGNKIGPNAPAPGQQAKNLRNLKILVNPDNPAARHILNEKFDVALPVLIDSDEQREKVAQGRVVTGSTVDPLTILPRANRFDASKTPPPIGEEDAQKGILSLIERGLIPPAAHLTLEPSPVRHKQAPLHDHLLVASKRKLLPPADTVGVGGFNLSNIRIDSRTVDIAKETSLAEKKKREKDMSSSMALVPSTKVWNQENKGRQLVPVKSIEGPLVLSGPSHAIQQVANHQGMLSRLSTPSGSTDQSKAFHKFVIQGGRTRITSQDYIDFKQHYCLSWGSILTLTIKLEKLLGEYSIPLAFIDGDRLADLALVFELEQNPSIEHFMTCIINSEEVERMINTPGRRFLGPNGHDVAATEIQSWWRRYKDRKAYLLHRKQKWAASVIAMSWIMNCKMSMIKKELKKTRQAQLERFKIRSKYLAENWDRIQQSRRVIIHIPSLGYAQDIRNGLSDIGIMQNLQMGRLCDIMDPKVEVIYISPVDLNEEMQQYYSKLIAMKAGSVPGTTASNDEDDDTDNRYKIIVPEALHSFPTHNMCVSSMLKYSPNTMNRIMNLIRGKDAYIVCGVLHKEDIYVADMLDLPILCPEPEVAHLYSTKSGSKRIFLSANVKIPPGEFDIYSLPQLHQSLAGLVTENLHIKRWLFKMDQEFDGRGTAYCDVTPHLECYSWALKECHRYSDKWNKKWAHEPTLIKVAAEIPQILAQYAAPVNKKVYTTWEKFLEAFLKRGGVIEAVPPSESITSVSVDMLIEPNGKANILTTEDQIHSTSPYMCWGYTIPQTSVEPADLCSAANDVAAACKLRGIVGYLTIDFVTFIDPKTMKQALWAVDMKLSYSDSMALTQLMLYVSGGTINPVQSTFKVPLPAPRVESARTKRRKRVSDENKVPPNPNRFAILSARLQHSNLAVIHYSVFFQMCRAHGIGFDVKEKAGTLFTLVDGNKRERLGMLVMSDDLQGSLATFARNLSVIHQEISAPNMPGDSNYQGAIDDIDSIIGTTDTNLKLAIAPSPNPQLKAPRPKEMQKILQEQRQKMLEGAHKPDNEKTNGKIERIYSAPLVRLQVVPEETRHKSASVVRSSISDESLSTSIQPDQSVNTTLPVETSNTSEKTMPLRKLSDSSLHKVHKEVPLRRASSPQRNLSPSLKLSLKSVTEENASSKDTSK